MTRGNTTFGGGDPTWANACVGNNGFPGYWEYATGFSLAANILIDKVLQARGLNYSVDKLVYPVCFNMRHSVELRLKGAISELMSIEDSRGRKIEFDLVGSHDIGNIWQFFVEKSGSIDDRYIAINARLEKKIIDITEIDATGQTFRYPLDTESQKHLVGVAVINFVNLKKSFSELGAALDNLHQLNRYLREEYGMRTFTKKLSRRNIFEIASKLPNRSEWTKQSFDGTKSSIKKLFKIGSKELSNSIKIIEAHFEFAPIIGMSIHLLGVTESDIYEFVGHWFMLYELSSDAAPIDYETNEWESDAIFQSLTQLTQDAKVRQEVWGAMQSKFTPEILAGLSALFYFAYELDFSERYVHIYKNSLREAVTAFEESDDAVRTKFFHIFDKTNAVSNILKSLYFLKKVEVAEYLVSAHGLDQKFSWLDEARSWGLFKKPEYCGYAI